ncbi:hypothetical protein N7462_004858 [Penicillium macrosclerotiorum]|uniref:uncharacterized protein n=1 Tax=Penicillium macrosclerotiorum TaxID=303699 RepID=UPI002547F6BF|nr:uncharacterized protein N7462_004858 [Penicillium macrosclerotiorum]KAJ5690466.1 hypothetical protein N7462_004858 [Penicillium macrosclerotiorum]
MTGPFHTYGPSCLLADEELELTSFYGLSSPPEVRAHFFYISSLPIDDPLAPLPPASGQPAEKERVPPKPFSARDNLALEASWREFSAARKAQDAVEREPRSETLIKGTSGIAVPGQSALSVQRRREATGLQNNFSYSSTADDGVRNIASSGENDRKRRSAAAADPYSTKGRRHSSEDNGDLEEWPADGTSLRANRSRDASISGSPFIRAPTSQPHSLLGRSVESLQPKDASQESQEEPQGSPTSRSTKKPSKLKTMVSLDELTQDQSQEESSANDSQSKIPVGASRLHLVEVPSLKMKPIYWSPLHDISNVIRATWFYKNTMLPVETDLANQLEEGYTYLKPWTETWQDELNSCVENGADAEMKIVHRLWPEEDPGSANPPESAQVNVEDIEAPREQPQGQSQFNLNHAAGETAAHAESLKPYATSSAIYADAQNAQILRPSLLPSVTRGRRPLSAIRKGRQIGIPVVRGFNRKAWDQLHPSKANPVDVRQYIRRNQSPHSTPTSGEQICYACKMEELRPSPTDLVFVIHGIGQKLSERMESFHFTHAINAFRRQVNMELNNEPVWPHVRQDHGGIMVLPVNWRTTLSLEDPSLESSDIEDPTTINFSLSDITPQTLPAVRSLISDVMLDIPYYLSHHKPKMIRAVAREANRIYRLWCDNNPEFQHHGRVHLLAHSLGSVMAVDILSQQPTNVPDFDFSKTPLHSDIFEFDTRNLFLCGSPLGFFLLLNKASLMPRRGREKPGSEGEDRLRGVAGEPGSYGCLPVDNLYNIMHTTDPIAYRVNAAVDTDLSNSLKTASIPSATSSFWQSLGSVFRWSSPGALMPSAAPIRPAAVTKLPSTVEMETHDFTREEIAEKRMLLLNDNGQIDYYLSGGGGPLNIQYLNMLSAHSSYWTLTDFVRFFVVEIARKQGRDGTLVAFRAEKKKGWKYSKG